MLDYLTEAEFQKRRAEYYPDICIYSYKVVKGVVYFFK